MRLEKPSHMIWVVVLAASPVEVGGVVVVEVGGVVVVIVDERVELVVRAPGVHDRQLIAVAMA